MNGSFFNVWVLLTIIVVVSIIAKTAKQHRRHASLTDRKPCKHCGAVYGAEARYCGRCGKPL